MSKQSLRRAIRFLIPVVAFCFAIASGADARAQVQFPWAQKSTKVVAPVGHQSPIGQQSQVNQQGAISLPGPISHPAPVVIPHSSGHSMIIGQPSYDKSLVDPTVAAGLESHCGCKNIPGGYPCKGPCQNCIMGVDCATCRGEERWSNIRRMPFSEYGPGGYAGPARFAHLSAYRLRPNDQIQLIYLITRRQENGEYRLAPGDELMIESIADPDLLRGTLQRGLEVQPDGTITVRLLGQVHAAGLTVSQLRKLLEKQYEKFYDQPAIDVTPVRTNTLAEDIRNAVGGQGGFTQQAITVTVSPDGTIRLPGIGGLCVQGLSLAELKKETNLRYNEVVVGLETEPVLVQQAPHFVHVLGQVGNPSRVQLDGPTTVLSAIASAGGDVPGSNLRQVVVLRRAEDWRLISTMLDLQGVVRGRRPTPSDEIWVRDGDVIIVPQKPIITFDNFIQQVFVNGIYGVIPQGLFIDGSF